MAPAADLPDSGDPMIFDDDKEDAVFVAWFGFAVAGPVATAAVVPAGRADPTATAAPAGRA
eukprot:9928440-Lingulodinium_polyedra.AAC.1